MASLLSQAFQNAKSENRPALLTYTVAGDNTKKKSLEILKSISNYADICELGFPHNTPIADGGQIQTSAYRAIKNGIKINDVFSLAKDFKNIVGVKEASGNLEQIMTIILKKPDNFLVISGDDALTLGHILVGGDGVISVIANAFPKRFSTMVNAALNKNLDLAKEKHYELFEIIHYLFVDGNPAGIKYLLKLINICSDYVRLPLVGVTEETSKKLYSLTASIDDTLV